MDEFAALESRICDAEKQLTMLRKAFEVAKKAKLEMKKAKLEMKEEFATFINVLSSVYGIPTNWVDKLLDCHSPLVLCDWAGSPRFTAILLKNGIKVMRIGDSKTWLFYI